MGKFLQKALNWGPEGTSWYPLVLQTHQDTQTYTSVECSIMSSLNIMKLLKNQNLFFFWCFHCQYCWQFYFVCWFFPHFLSSFISVQGENNKGCNNIAPNLAEYESLRDALPLCLAAMFRWCKCNYFYGVHVMAFLWMRACTHVQCPFLTLSNDLFLQSKKQRIKTVEWFKRYAVCLPPRACDLRLSRKW